MSSTLLKTSEDLKWLRETHLKGHYVPPHVIAILYGNEDCPERIELYVDDHYKSRPAVYELRDSGRGYWLTHIGDTQ